MTMQHKFVEFMPDLIEEGVLYISLDYGTVIHKCACGCGNEVNTPLSPTGWHMIYDGNTVTLKPSIGNWSFECRSHYWITNNDIKWASSWSKAEIERTRKIEDSERINFYGEDSNSELQQDVIDSSSIDENNSKSKPWYDFLFFWKVLF